MKKLQWLYDSRSTCIDCHKNYDCHSFEINDVLSPWQLWHGSKSPDLTIVGQDWASSDHLKNNSAIVSVGANSKVKSNKLLMQAVQRTGLQMAPPGSDTSMSRIFLTNAFLCLKEGDMSRPIPARLVRACTKKFTLPAISSLKPKVLVTLGAQAFSAVWANTQSKKSPTFTEAVIAADPLASIYGAKWFDVHHPAARGISKKKYFAEWDRIAPYLASPAKACA